MVQTRILVVEDEVIVADDIRRSLQNLGYDVTSIASSGEIAIKNVEENTPDLVLMDIMLQGKMDGIEAASQIKSRFGIPVVYLTAYSDEKIMERAKITEPFGYLIKPFRDREVQINIEIALYKNKIERELKESREWFYVTLKSISDAVIATDPKGCVLFMNPTAQSMTGWAFEEVQGKPLKDVFNIVSEKTDDKGMQTILIDKSKTKIQIQDSNNVIKDDRGNIIGIVLVFRKIA
ncbi:MAG: response regulator [Euryarchaeota archaeon]|nr:response regulator [Euryarchaeota archaeon]MBU4220111.1 response regulator [Euryarchaeota archaeon]MBU4339840.1 response regulator [Euryarchaeota archaeon]MBU4454788.1 response regulator [Euryarchaeota archaeon]MCG2737680.1 response regulator [Candidatus Methanoperedenaceae archaeon]